MSAAKVELIVQVPDPHSGDPVFLAAEPAHLGRWTARGQPFERWEAGRYRLLLTLEAGTKLRYLVTRGHWRQAELDEHGRERLPRELTAEPGLRVEFRVASWGRSSVHYHHDRRSRFLRYARSLIVWLPPGYGLQNRRYPVLYMQDGQNLFDAHTAFAGVPWRCDEIAEQAIRSGEAEPLIIVGIANTPDRIREYGPRRCGPAREDDLSREYGRFLVEEVKPFIDSRYPTLLGPEHSGIGGSSMGGLISLHLCKWYPRVWGRCLAMSPSLWWQREYFLRTVRAGGDWVRKARIWLDMGGREGASRTGMRDNLRRARALNRHLTRLASLSGASASTSVRYVEDAEGGHNEWAWAARFADAIRFLFPPEPDVK